MREHLLFYVKDSSDSELVKKNRIRYDIISQKMCFFIEREISCHRHFMK